MKRCLILAASVVMQMCLGATYAWSVFVQPLRESTGLMQGPVQLPFTLFYFAFPLTMIFAGSWLSRFGPRRCAVMGGLMFGGGWWLAGWGHLHFGITVLGIGLLAGTGAGCAYIVPIATCIRWFPAHKGLVTGVAVAGFGGGAALVSQAGAWLMAVQGASPFETFRWLGALFMLLVTCAGMCMRNPPGSGYAAADRLAWRHVVRRPAFQLLYFTMFCGLAAGFAVNANLKDLLPGGGLGAGVTAVGVFALANAAGRMAWGWLFDRLGARTIVSTNLAVQAAVLLSAPWVLVTETGLVVFALLTGFNYGGVLVVYASSVAHRWGAAAVGQVYGLLFSANIPAAVAPMAAGFLFDAFGTFTPAFWGLAGLIAAAVVMFIRASGNQGQPAGGVQA